MSTIALTVNGRAHSLDVDPATPLLYVLSDDLALRGPNSAAASDSAAPARSSLAARRAPHA